MYYEEIMEFKDKKNLTDKETVHLSALICTGTFTEQSVRDMRDEMLTHHTQAIAKPASCKIYVDWLHELQESSEAVGAVCYYPSVWHYLNNRKVRTTLGKYLTKYNGIFGLSEVEIKKAADAYRAQKVGGSDTVLKFIASDDKQGWVRVYDEGPASCMKSRRSVHVYAHDKSVLRLAYLEHQGEIMARAIVRDDEKGFIRIYPDPDGNSWGNLLEQMLKAEGYDHETDMQGVWLDADHLGDGKFTMPYVDTGDGNDPYGELAGDGDYIEIVSWGSGGREDLQTTSGWVYFSYWERCSRFIKTKAEAEA